jgi:hypothetical protein
MIALIALAAAASATPPAPVSTGPVVQALATVRIVSGVRLKLDGSASANADAPPPRETIIVAGGEPQPASLIEFQ